MKIPITWIPKATRQGWYDDVKRGLDGFIDTDVVAFKARALLWIAHLLRLS